MEKKRIRSIFIIAFCIILFAFGLYDQIQSIQMGKTISEVISEGMEGTNG